MKTNGINLQVCLLQYEQAWDILLGQIGIPWSIIETIELLQPHMCSLVIGNKQLSAREKSSLQQFLSDGGAVLYTPSGKFPFSTSKYVTSLPPKQTKVYSYFDTLDIYDRCFLFPNNEIVHSHTFGKGIATYLGIDIARLLLSIKNARKNFYSPSERLPNEIVSRVSKAPMRQLVTSLLEYLHHQRNLPFVHKWYYPENEPTIFTFRIDSDKGSQEQIDESYRLSEQYQIPTTWFLDVKSHQEWLGYFSQFTAQEIGVHCYEHVVYNSTVLNKENFEKALELLRAHKFNVKGVTAPTGTWNIYFAKAIEELGFEYSSEFGFDYDNLPSYPARTNAFSPVLQLPIHPVCVGSMLRARLSFGEMIEYFKNIVDLRIQTNQPVCLYHHPTHKHNEVFEEVFRYINGHNIRKFSYSQYAGWWKKRNKSEIAVVYDGTNLLLDKKNRENDVWLRISLPNDKETIVPMNDTMNIESLTYSPKKKFPAYPNDIMRTRMFDVRHYVQNALDWWIKVTE